MKKYTPSPWVAVGTWVEHPSDTVPDICDCDPRSMDQQLYRSDEEACANARLIAAAPEMLEALQFIMKGVAGCQTERQWEYARAVIAKAIGETT